MTGLFLYIFLNAYEMATLPTNQRSWDSQHGEQRPQHQQIAVVSWMCTSITSFISHFPHLVSSPIAPVSILITNTLFLGGKCQTIFLCPCLYIFLGWVFFVCQVGRRSGGDK